MTMPTESVSALSLEDPKPNRNPIKQWFITFPQYQRYAAAKSEGMETAAENLNKTNYPDYFPPCTYAICCEETHEDGGLHLHMGIKLLKPISKSKMKKWIDTKFPNDSIRIHYKALKNWDHVVDYCNKEDPSAHVRGSL